MAEGSRAPTTLEGRGGLIGATALVALVVSTLGAYGVWSSFQSRGWDVGFGDLFLRFAAGWSLWVLVAVPVIGLSLQLWRRVGPWPLAVLLQLLLSAVVAWSHAWSNDQLQMQIDRLLSDGDGRRGGSAEAGPERERTDGERSPATATEHAPGGAGADSGDGEPAPAVVADTSASADDRADADEGDADAADTDGRGGRRPPRRSRGGSRRWSDPRNQLPNSFMQYWVVVALGAGLVGTRRARSEERRAAAAELDATRAQTALVQAQLEALRAQVHPHFLFNALHTVGGLVREGREDDALTALRGLGDLLRAALRRGPDRQETTLDDELSLVREYLALETLRFDDRLRHDLDQQPGTGALPVPCLCLLPLVENAVRYAVEPRAEGGRLELSAALQGDELVLSVSDDGPGFPADVLAAGGGSAADREQVGLANTSRRLAMLYGEAGRMQLENPPGGGARVTLRLPRGGAGG